MWGQGMGAEGLWLRGTLQAEQISRQPRVHGVCFWDSRNKGPKLELDQLRGAAARAV